LLKHLGRIKVGSLKMACNYYKLRNLAIGLGWHDLGFRIWGKMSNLILFYDWLLLLWVLWIDLLIDLTMIMIKSINPKVTTLVDMMTRCIVACKLLKWLNSSHINTPNMQTKLLIPIVCFLVGPGLWSVWGMQHLC
jgi:hypothetical protein